MGGAKAAGQIKPQPCLLVVTVVFTLFLGTAVLGDDPSSSFSPADSYLINCGSSENVVLDDGRSFMSDKDSASYLSTDEDILTSIDTFPSNVTTSASSSPSTSSVVLLPLYLSARIFRHESMYRFPIVKPGRHWLRLYFYPVPDKSINLNSPKFNVRTDDVVLLHGFSVDSNKMVLKEYLITINSDRFTLMFSPMKNYVAFINGIELVSAPEDLIPDMNKYAMEVSYRLNVGGPTVTPKNDTLSRTWLPDAPFMVFHEGAKSVSVPNDMIQYPKDGGGDTPLIAPYSVYATADQMADSSISDPNFNLTWEMNVDPTFSYLIRLHFCDIVSTGLDELYFNVYINGLLVVSGLDLSTITSGLAIPYYKDFVLNASSITNSTVVIQVGPTSNIQSSTPNAILNGLEVMKLSNSAGSLDGLFSQNGMKIRQLGSTAKIVAVVGLSLGAAGLCMFLVRMMIVRQKMKRPKGYQKQKTLSSWILNLNSNQFSFLSSKTKTATFSSSVNLGRCFTLHDIRDATNNFDEKHVVGVGGFGKVYVGVLDEMKVAIKRGNASSSQGINEFQTEIQLLSKLRHRHLVSLIGYCDEQGEMILVYEYMAKGPLRDHLYGSDSANLLSWRQRLEVCIGSARGLHYLHTGSTQGIIHRDVKTTNILLDENFVAKVSDFGLSKAGPASLDQTHVSTAVKGSFGYLDPEYFRRQQLTEKSDVYSFGVVLFEVLCARPALDPGLPREQVNLAEWAKQHNAKGTIKKIIDPVIVDTINPDSLIKYVEAAEKCLAEYGVDRPSMGDVLWNLEYALQLQETTSNNDTNGNESGKKGKEEEVKDQLIVNISDDSGVAVASPMFNANFQAR